MKTVQPGFLAMAAGSERRRKRDRGKEDALTPLRMRGVETGKASEQAKHGSRVASRLEARRESARGLVGTLFGVAYTCYLFSRLGCRRDEWHPVV